MEQSAVTLKLEKDRQITDVGLEYGYTPSNYSAAFRKHHSVSPAQFRKNAAAAAGMENPFYPNGARNFDTYGDYAEKIRIRELPETTVIYERVFGNYGALKDKWPLFLAKYRDHIRPQICGQW
jgi:AraC family transcriptional regulator